MGSATCKGCGAPIDESLDGPNGERSPCPECGATARVVEESISLGVAADLDVGYRLKRPRQSLGNRRRWAVEETDETQYSRKYDRYVRVFRTVDREADWYFERIVDRETEKVLEEKSHPLTEHTGHGSAKKG